MLLRFYHLYKPRTYVGYGNFYINRNELLFKYIYGMVNVIAACRTPSDGVVGNIKIQN